MDKPIIDSMLDLDKYKLTMCQIVNDLYPNEKVTYSFSNRTMSIKLANFLDMDELVEQINHMKSLRFSYDDLTYLKNQPEYKDHFINMLARQKYDTEFTYQLQHDKLNLHFTNRWQCSILYETMILGIINELFARSVLEGLTDTCIYKMRNDAIGKLQEKIKIIKKHDIKFIDFGTRRRHSGNWQKAILEICRDECPNNILGTSNYLMAKELGLNPIGTQAHEFFMVRAAIEYERSAGDCLTLPDSKSLLDAQKKAMNEWYDYYGEPLSIMLTDTFGTNAFLKDFDEELATKCVGVRQDSGDPIKFGYKMIEHYKKFGIDTKTKKVIFSDGLNVDKMVKIQEEFKDKFKVYFGWGTDLTNSVGIKPLSIVIKATGVNEEQTVKLSDNIKKATGTPAYIQMYQSIFQPEQTDVETVY